ncbi:MAG: ATP-binding protein [Fidelibacterota bacterium]
MAKATYELPPNAIGEAIVNAIAHRDYHSNASVEIRLFADRLEVWNPGSLPGTLTTEMLRHDHPSLPNNPLLAESLYLTRYIEKAGFGTQAIIDECRAIGLPEPDFEQRGGSFVVTLWRDWLTNEILDMLNLNERQLKVIALIKQQQKLTTKQYQEITGASRATSKCDLEDFVRKGVLILKGEGRGAYYELSKKRLKWLMKVNASWNPGESRNP